MKFTHAKLHNGEEHWKHLIREQIAELAAMVEILISAMVLIALIIYTVSMFTELGSLTGGHGDAFEEFLEDALNLVIGVEFIKMLSKHSPGSALEVLMYAIARHMVLNHASALDNIMGVTAIAIIFAVRKFLYVPDFGGVLQPEPEPEPEKKAKTPAAQDAAADGEAGEGTAD